MSIKSFNEFTEEIVNESDVYGATGKTKFSRWLRNVNSRIKEEMGDSYYSKYYDDHNDPFKTARMATNLIPNTVRLITGAGAAIADFFSKGDNKDSFSKLSKSELSGKKLINGRPITLPIRKLLKPMQRNSINREFLKVKNTLVKNMILQILRIKTRRCTRITLMM